MKNIIKNGNFEERPAGTSHLRFFSLLCFILQISAFILSASAAITQTISYQGFLLSKITNLPVETPQDMKFVLYNAASGGAVQFTEARCKVPVSRGRYDVEIGSATAGGIPDTVFSGASSLWLEIQLDPDNNCSGAYEAMTPRIRLQASPYAFNALYASTASAATPVFSADVINALPQTTYGAVTISTNLFVMGGISVGSISPGQKLSVAGIVESTGVGGGFMFPDGSIQYVAAANTMWKISGDNLYSINPGNVGIGETSPLASLHVSTGAGYAGDILILSTGPAAMFHVNGLGQVYGGSYYGNGAMLGGIVAKAGDTMTGQLTLAGSSFTVTSPLGLKAPKIKLLDNVEISSAAAAFYGGISISTNVYLPAGARYYGNGGGLYNLTTLDPTKVSTAGDTMSGQLTLANSTLTVTGAAFSVGGSALSVLAGNTALGSLSYLARLTVGGDILATASVTAQGGFYSPLANISQNLTASSGTFTAGGAAQYSLETSSGIKVNAGRVTAPFFAGDGSMLSNLSGTDAARVLKAGDTMTGNLAVNGASVTIVYASPANAYAFTVSSAQAVNAYGLSVTTAGRVGVQVSMPSAPLEVYKQILVSNMQGGAASFYAHANAGNMTYLRWTEDTRGDQGALGFPLASRDLVYRAGGSDPSTNGQEVFRISADAAANWKFGIGTNSPQEKFHIASNLLVSTSAANPILYISTTSGLVSISTGTQTHALTVNGGIVAFSSITAQGGFYGSGAGLTNIGAGGLPKEIQVSTISAAAGSFYDGVVIVPDVNVSSRLAVGQPFTPAYDLHVRGITGLDQKKPGDPVILGFYPYSGGDSYIDWSENSKSTKGALGMPAGLRDLVLTMNTVKEEVFRVKGNSSGLGGAGWQFGIGTANPGASFHVAADMLVSSSPLSPVLFVSTGEGAVGVWTNAPEERFNVASTALFGSKAFPLIYASTATNNTGIGTTSPRVTLEVGGNFIAGGAYSFPPNPVAAPVSGSGARMMWIPSAAAFRAGYATGSEWDNVGLYSVAMGYHGAATGQATTVGGGFNNAADSFDYATISGGNNNKAQGLASVVSGGRNNTVTGEYSMIPGGNFNIIHSSFAFAGGQNNNLTTNAARSFVWGWSGGATTIDKPDVFIIDPSNTGFKVGVGNNDPQARLDVNGSAQFGAGVTKSTFTAEGYWQPRSMTTAEIQAATPTVIGAVVYNSILKNICFSTGTVNPGDWAIAGTKGNCY